MSDAPPGGDAGRLIACHACGNRVVRSARRCPACGARDPAMAPREPATPRHEPARAAADSVGATPESAVDEPAAVPPGLNPAGVVARPRGLVLGFVLSALAGALAAGLVAYLMWPAPPRPPREAAPAPPAPATAVPATTPAPTEGSTPTEASAPAEVPSAAGAAPPPAATESSGQTPATSPAVPIASRSRGRSDWLFFFKPGDRLARMTDEAPVGLVVRTERSHTFPDGTTGPAYLLQVSEGGQRFMDADELERGTRLQ